MNFNHTKKYQHCNNFREFLIRIRYPVIKPRVFFHFSPIPHSPIPHKSPLLTLSLLPKQIFSVIFFNVVLTLLDFFYVDYQPGDQERREKWLWIRNKLMKSTSYSGYTCRLLCSRNILREFIWWIGVFAFCFILFHFFLFFFNKNDKKNLHSTKFVSFDFDF